MKLPYSSIIPLLGLNALLVGLVAWSPLAHAQQQSADADTAEAPTGSAVVLTFGGRGGAAARTQVVRGLNGVVELAPRADANAAARTLQADLDQTEGRAAVAVELGVDLVVFGRVQGRGAAAQTEIIVESSAGEELQRRQSGGPNGRANRARIQSDAAEMVSSSLALLQRREEEAVAAAAAVAEAERLAAEEARLAEESAAQEAAETAADTERSPTPRAAIFLGLGMRNRDFVASQGGVEGAFYDVGMYAQLSIRADSFPLGASSSTAARGVYTRFEYATALGLETESTAGTLSSSAYQLGIHAGYLYPFQNGKVGALVGYAMTRFNPGGDPFVPASKYQAIRFAPAGSIDIVGELLAIDVEYGIRALLGVGELDAYGADTSGLGIDFVMRLHGAADFGLAYAMQFSWERYMVDYSGATSGTFPPADESTDTSLALVFEVGYQFD